MFHPLKKNISLAEISHENTATESVILTPADRKQSPACLCNSPGAFAVSSPGSLREILYVSVCTGIMLIGFTGAHKERFTRARPNCELIRRHLSFLCNILRRWDLWRSATPACIVAAPRPLPPLDAGTDLQFHVGTGVVWTSGDMCDMCVYSVDICLNVLTL